MTQIPLDALIIELREDGPLPGMDFYNVKRDPGEKYGQLYPGLFAVAPIQMFVGSHMGMIQKFPHRDPSELRAKKKSD